jgi:hypothetical protein
MKLIDKMNEDELGMGDLFVERLLATGCVSQEIVDLYATRMILAFRKKGVSYDEDDEAPPCGWTHLREALLGVCDSYDRGDQEKADAYARQFETLIKEWERQNLDC